MYININTTMSIMADRNMLVKYKMRGTGGVFFSMPKKDIIIAARKMCTKRND